MVSPYLEQAQAQAHHRITIARRIFTSPIDIAVMDKKRFLRGTATVTVTISPSLGATAM